MVGCVLSLILIYCTDDQSRHQVPLPSRFDNWYSRPQTYYPTRDPLLFSNRILNVRRNLSYSREVALAAGWAVGILSMSVPVYQAECAHSRSRGFLSLHEYITVPTWMIPNKLRIVGLAQQMIGSWLHWFSTWIGYGSLHAPDTNQVQWRFPLCSSSQHWCCLWACSGFLRSPRHLIEKQNDDEALWESWTACTMMARTMNGSKRIHWNQGHDWRGERKYGPGFGWLCSEYRNGGSASCMSRSTFPSCTARPTTDWNKKAGHCSAGIHSNDWYQRYQLLSKYHVSFPD